MKAAYQDNSVTIYQGDVRQVLRELESGSVHCVVTSPPYWGLRDYGTASWEGGLAACDHLMPRVGQRQDGKNGSHNGNSDGFHGGRDNLSSKPYIADCGKCGATRIDRQIGLEDSPVKYVVTMREVFTEVRRVLRDDGTLWLNMGDSYASTWSCGRRNAVGNGACDYGDRIIRTGNGLKEKDLVGIPWMLAFALREDGWYLRSDIIWHKPNPMPESVTDRPTKSHEYLFLLSKSERYYYDAEAIAEACIAGDNGSSFTSQQDVLTKENLGQGPRTIKRPKGWATGSDHSAVGWATEKRQGRTGSDYTEQEEISTTRNRRSVWSVSTEAFPEAHFATFPQELIKPCILAGCPKGGVVLDPFMGSGTTGLVAKQNGCQAIGIELNPDYIKIAAKRLRQEVLTF